MKEYKIIKQPMVVFAHPDDAEIGTGATIAKWIKNGSEVVYVLATTGSSGSNDKSMTSNKIVDIRSNEQIEAAKILGIIQTKRGAGSYYKEFRSQDLTLENLDPKQYLLMIRLE